MNTTRFAPLLLGALALSAPLLAHPPGTHPGMDMHDDMFATMDANHDGRISAREHAAAAQAMFARADANHDGVVTLDEMQAMHPHGGDHDDAMAQDKDHDHDAGSAATRPAMPMDHDDHMPPGGGMHHDMDRMRDHFQAMDANGDGRLSASEHAAGAAKMFASLDANHDGFLSRAEFDAGHAAMMHGAKDHEHMDHDHMDHHMDQDDHKPADHDDHAGHP